MRTPDDLSKALDSNPKAKKNFEEFSPSHRNEYIEWIVDAKMEVTRARRVKTALGWIERGKSRNWKYET